MHETAGKISRDSPKGCEDEAGEDPIGPAVAGEDATERGMEDAGPVTEWVGHTRRYFSQRVSPGRRVLIASRMPALRKPGVSSSQSEVPKGTKYRSRAA